jgi:hypothetical protein
LHPFFLKWNLSSELWHGPNSNFQAGASILIIFLLIILASTKNGEFMAVSLGFSILARAALTAKYIPHAFGKSYATALVYSAADMLVCALASRYVLGKFQKAFKRDTNDYTLAVGMTASRVAGLVAGVVATVLFCNDKVSPLQALLINMGAGFAGLLPELDHYFRGEDTKFPIQV